MNPGSPMAPNHHPTPLFGGDRKGSDQGVGKARAMTGILAVHSAEMRLTITQLKTPV